MTAWNNPALKSLFVPGGVLLLASALLLQGGLVAVPVAALRSWYFAAFVAGILLALRFQSSRVLMALITLLLADRAVAFFAGHHGISTGPGRAAFELIALLLPLNFILLAVARERGFIFPQISAALALLFAESVLVTLLAQPETKTPPAFLHYSLVDHRLLGWTRIPQLALLAFVIAFVILLFRSLAYRKPVESGLFWALAAAFLAWQTGALGRTATGCLASAALILVTAIVETSYLMAFHDELTALPARRAFHQALPGLPETYAIAVVDIDHFKRFNDTYGHQTGDQVLRMVAARLARVGGGGRAFRVGGEEFTILFPGKSAREAAPHLEALRAEIESSTFRVRGETDRRVVPRGSDRRRATARRRSSRVAGMAEADGHVAVTVSIGVAECSPHQREPEQAMRAADKALYRAKQAGRNRLELASSSRLRGARRSIA